MTQPRSAMHGALLLACALAATTAWAQSAPQSSAAASAAERAQKESDRTMYWIRILADKPAPAKAAPTAAPKPVAAVAPVAKPVAEAREKVKVAAAAPLTTNVAPAATTTPARATVAPLQEPAPAPVVGVPDPAAPASGGVDNTPADTALIPPEPAPVPEPDPGLQQIKSVQPDFPGNVVLKVRKGNVEVQFEVEPGGTVVDASVVQSSNARLNAAAIEAVRQWRFKPGPKGHLAAVNLVFDIDKE